METLSPAPGPEPEGQPNSAPETVRANPANPDAKSEDLSKLAQEMVKYHSGDRKTAEIATESITTETPIDLEAAKVGDELGKALEGPVAELTPTEKAAQIDRSIAMFTRIGKQREAEFKTTTEEERKAKLIKVLGENRLLLADLEEQKKALGAPSPSETSSATSTGPAPVDVQPIAVNDERVPEAPKTINRIALPEQSAAAAKPRSAIPLPGGAPTDADLQTMLDKEQGKPVEATPPTKPEGPRRISLGTAENPIKAPTDADLQRMLENDQRNAGRPATERAPRFAKQETPPTESAAVKPAVESRAEAATAPEIASTAEKAERPAEKVAEAKNATTERILEAVQKVLENEKATPEQTAKVLNSLEKSQQKIESVDKKSYAALNIEIDQSKTRLKEHLAAARSMSFFSRAWQFGPRFAIQYALVLGNRELDEKVSMAMLKTLQNVTAEISRKAQETRAKLNGYLEKVFEDRLAASEAQAAYYKKVVEKNRSKAE